MLDILKILFCIPFLIYSCYSDIKTRRVSNKVWLVMLAGNVFFIIYDLSKYGLPYLYDFSKHNLPFLPRLLISAGLMYLFLAFYELLSKLTHSRMMGGADAKLLLVISVIFPVYPAFEVLDNFFPAVAPLNLFAFSVLGDAVFAAMLIPIGFAAYNIHKMGFHVDKPAYFFLGYKMKITNLDNKHVWIIQDFEEINGNVKSNFKRSGIEINGEYLFAWDEIPGNDNERLTDYLKEDVGIDWAKRAKIEKTKDGRMVRIFTEKNSLTLRLNDEKTKVVLKIDNDRNEELIVRIENGELNIYEGYIIPKLKNLLERGLIKDEIWVTPKLPFMIPITFGFFVAVFYGDLIFEVTKLLILK